MKCCILKFAEAFTDISTLQYVKMMVGVEVGMVHMMINERQDLNVFFSFMMVLSGFFQGS